MILDGHIHIGTGERDRSAFSARLEAAGVGGGALLSLPPACMASSPASPKDRLDDLFYWAESGPELYPLYWIDPLEGDALAQVEMAVTRGVSGFKVICDRYYPGDERAMRVFAKIAQAGKPILFHSGILWDGKSSSPYNRPAEFEALLEVPGLSFCLAHISWPWCDELIAVYGKLQNALTARPDLAVEMYIDITPGTPPIYRRDALTKLYTVGYDVERNVIFGSDSAANEYSVEWVREWLVRDREILADIGVNQETLADLYAGNLRRFLGLTSEKVAKQPLRSGA